MNAETNPAVPVSSSYGSPGAAIRDARTRAGMSLDELASRTRLARATLEALERDAYDQLLEPVYVRGYYRKCARILNLPEQPLIEAYEAAYTPAPVSAPARLRLASGGELGSVPRVSRRLAVLAPLLAIVLVPAIWLLRDWSPGSVPGVGGGSTLTPIEPPQSTAPPILDTPAPAETVGEAATPAAVNVATGESPGSTAPLPVDPTAGSAPGATPATPGSATVSATESAPAAAPSGTQLVLVFEAISWARVEDASGKSLLSGVIGAGESRMIDGRPPYSVFLGNAPGVKVEFGGRPIDLKAYTKGNSTARFSVPGNGG